MSKKVGGVGGTHAPRRISEDRRRFLDRESGNWVEDGIISEDQRGEILAGYTVAGNLPIIVLTLGMSMIGIGVMCFIAANWRVMPALLKVILVVGSYSCSVGGAYYAETRGRVVVSESLLLLSGFLLLGGLALISQVFHIQGSPTGLLWTWLAAFAPTFLIVRNVSIYVLYEIVTVIYINILYFDYMDHVTRFVSDSAFSHLIIGPYQPLAPIALLCGVAWRAWALDRKAARAEAGPWVRKFFVGGASRRIFLSNFLIINVFVWLCVINNIERTLPYVLGILIIGAVILSMGWKLGASDLDWQGLLCVGASGMALTFPIVWQLGSSSYDYYSDGGAPLAYVLVPSAALAAYLVYRIVRRRRGGGCATFLFCALIARWYFDKFYSFMSKSLFFITGGVILLLVAYAYRRWNKLGSKRGDVDDAGASL